MQVLALADLPESSPTVEASATLLADLPTAGNETVHNPAVEAPSNLLEFPTQPELLTRLPMVAEASVVYNASPSAETYSPSRQELRQWCAVAMASENEPLKAQIIAKGQQLKALYGG